MLTDVRSLLVNILVLFISGYWGIVSLGWAFTYSGYWGILSFVLLAFAAIGGFNSWDALSGAEAERMRESIRRDNEK